MRSRKRLNLNHTTWQDDEKAAGGGRNGHVAVNLGVDYWRIDPVEELQRQVRRTRWRLGIQRFLASLGWCGFATMLIALMLIVAGRFWPLGVDDWIWAVAAIGLAVAGALVWAVATGRGPVDAAIELDCRFGLKERVSSALCLPPTQQETEAGRALIDDAVRRVERVDVASRFAISPGKPLLLPLLPGAVAVLLALLVGPAAVQNRAGAKTDPAAIKRQVKKSSQSLRRKLIGQRKKAQEQGLKDAEQLFKRLEQGTKQLADQAPADRKKALVKLNDLAREMKKRRRQLGGADKVKQQLNRLKDLGQGPAEKFARAVSRGDFKRAMEELDRLKQNLAKGELDEKQRQELARQLAQMKDKLKDLARAHQAAQEDLAKRVDQLRKAGRHDEANRLEEQLDRLRDQLPQMQRLDQLADRLGQCSKCLRQGQLADAGGALENIQADLGDLRRQLDELEMLDEAMDQLAQARNRMVCPHCGGAGCQACQGNRPGLGIGVGRGHGNQPEEKTDSAFYDSRVRQKVGKGTANVVDLVDGPNVKGNVQQQIRQQYDAARQQPTDPLTGRQIPRKHRKHAREYFDRFREGE